MKIRLVRGNEYKLRVIVRRVRVFKGRQEIVGCDLAEYTAREVWLVDAYGLITDLAVSAVDGNVLEARLPEDLREGPYTIVVRFGKGGVMYRSEDRGILGVVPFNGMGRIPLDAVPGKSGDQFAMRYYISTDGDSAVPEGFKLYYGPASASAPDELEPESALTLDTGYEAERILTLTTTADKPYIWFVCTKELTFTQAGLPASLNEAQKDGMYWYWTDELLPGDDNTYNVILK